MTSRAGYALALAIFVIFNASSSAWVAGQALGGRDAVVNSAPFIVSIQKVIHSGNKVHYCGGTIINANWVLTAAHCLHSGVVKTSVLIAGSILVSGTASTAQTRSIDYSIRNELYGRGAAPYDIGLIYTKTAFQWTSSVKAATLPIEGVIPTGSASFYGWGSTSNTKVDTYPTTLQIVRSVPIITLLQCENSLGKLAVNLDDTNLCTGPLNGGISICTSDSGGPLMQANTLIGIISWGKTPCGQANSPSVFVRVSAFNSWIAQHQVAPK